MKTVKNETQRTFSTFSVPVQDLFTGFITDCKVRQLSPHSVEFYVDKLTVFLAFCEAQAIATLDQIDTPFIRTFFQWLEETGHNPGGQHAFYRVLRAVFRWMENEFDGYTSPLRKIKAPRVDIPPIEGAKPDEFHAMLEACKKSSYPERDRALLLTLLDTGLRASEFLSLTWDDIDLTSGTIQVRRGKNRKPRKVFLGRLARQAMRAYAKTRKDSSPTVWLSRYGESLGYDGLRAVLTRLAKHAGLKNVPSPHDFRRASALQMLRNGADPVSVSRLLGHSSLEVTKRYLAQTESDLQETHRRHSPVDRLKS